MTPNLPGNRVGNPSSATDGRQIKVNDPKWRAGGKLNDDLQLDDVSHLSKYCIKVMPGGISPTQNTGTFEDALRICETHGMWMSAPEALMHRGCLVDAMNELGRLLDIRSGIVPASTKPMDLVSD
ncbi:hypothetical protein B566_EDAN017971 [Ephemera danica]|nr:hypothetical protein B566_EDAN017971 [Ephemera danica]